jgi:surface polysaccharide O-acyltransferase-like enzyme
MNANTAPSPSRIYYFDFLRVLSAFFVVLLHVAAQSWDDVPARSSNWLVMNAYGMASAPSVALFLMISGALMLDVKKKRPLKKILSKVLTIIVVYHVWLLLYSFCPFLFGEKAWSGLSLKADIFYPVITGQAIFHLWFLPEIAVIYMLSPLLKEVVKSRKLCEYYLCLYGLLGVLVPSILRFHIPGKTIFDSLYFRTTLPMLSGYMGCFVTGYYLHEYVNIGNSAKNRILLSVWAFGGWLASFSLNVIDGWIANRPSTIVYYPLFAGIFVTAISLFVMGKWLPAPSNPGMLASLSSLTFGIYLVHPFAIKLLATLGMSATVPHSSIMVPVFTLVAFALSCVFVFVLKHIKLLNKLVAL